MRNRVAVLAVLLCLQFNAPHVAAQEYKVLSEKPFIAQTFDPARNETEVKLDLSSKGVKKVGEFTFGKDKSNPAVLYAQVEPGAPPPIQSGLLLGYASYVYEGRSPAARRDVRLTFYSKRKDVFKDQAAFSISIEGQTAYEGTVVLASQPLLDDEFKQKVMANVPTDVFLRAARAGKVLFVLGPKAYRPKDFQQKSMRALADMIDPQGK